METPSLADALARPVNAIAYDIASALVRARPDKCVLFVEDGSFWLDDFEREGRCVRVPMPGTLPLVDVQRGEDDLIRTFVNHGFHAVQWSGQRFEVFTLRYGNDDCTYRRSFIVCDQHEAGE